MPALRKPTKKVLADYEIIFGPKPLPPRFGEIDVTAPANILYPNTSAPTRNRQCHAPFITVWNHAVRNNWAEQRQWVRPKKAKGTASVGKPQRSGTRPVSYERAAQFVLAMSPGQPYS